MTLIVLMRTKIGVKQAQKSIVKIEAQKVASIEIISTNLVEASDGKSATFNYEVKNQYFADITKTANIKPAASKGNIILLNS